MGPRLGQVRSSLAAQKKVLSRHHVCTIFLSKSGCTCHRESHLEAGDYSGHHMHSNKLRNCCLPELICTCPRCLPFPSYSAYIKSCSIHMAYLYPTYPPPIPLQRSYPPSTVCRSCLRCLCRLHPSITPLSPSSQPVHPLLQPPRLPISRRSDPQIDPIDDRKKKREHTSLPRFLPAPSRSLVASVVAQEVGAAPPKTTTFLLPTILIPVLSVILTTDGCRQPEPCSPTAFPAALALSAAFSMS